MIQRTLRFGPILGLAAALAACGGGSGSLSGGSGSLAGESRAGRQASAAETAADQRRDAAVEAAGGGRQSTFLDLFANRDDPNTTVEVNKYLWNAALDVLSFLPIQSVDPFTGVIVTGFGTPPGGGRAFRATIYIQDPALDARSLKLALATSAGPASPETVRAVEDAILTRARQLRIADSRL